MEHIKQVSQLNESIDQLLDRLTQIQAEYAQQKEIILNLTHERDKLLSKVDKAHHRLQTLIEKFPQLERMGKP